MAYPAQRVGEHDQEADHVANFGAQGGFENHRGDGQNTDTKSNTETLGRQQKKKREEQWMRHRDENSKQVNWITLSKIAVPLKASTAIEAEVAGAYIRTKVPKLIFGQHMNVDMFTRCFQKNADVSTKEE